MPGRRELFSHEDSHWGFRPHLKAHELNRYGLVAMVHGERGTEFFAELCRCIQRVCGWDALQTKEQFPFSEHSTSASLRSWMSPMIEEHNPWCACCCA